MTKTALRRVIAALVFLCIAVASVSAQQAAPAVLTLHLRRDWGYGGMGEIQGNFTISASGSSDLTRVVFRIDDQVMADLKQPPWQLKFHTDQYPAGPHALYALGYTAAGQEVRSTETRVRFLSSQQAGKASISVVAVLLGGMAAVALLAGTLTHLLSRGSRADAHPSRGYGWTGGAVCPKCGRGFGLHWWAPNLIVFDKLDVCPHCGRWSLVRRASPEQLAAAEALERQAHAVAPSSAVADPDQALQREVDESRYVDL